MASRAARGLAIAGVVFGALSFLAETAQAYTLVDWMRMWPRYGTTPVNRPAAPVAPVLPLPPPTTAAPVAPAPAIPVAPAVSVTPGGGFDVSATTGPPTGAYCFQTCPQVVSYQPEVRYQTRWLRVPTTNYRPVSTINPLTGCTTTCMQPCTTYTWQVQRVPVTAYRPVYSNVRQTQFLSGCGLPAFGAAPLFGGTAGSGCQSCAPGVTVTAAPLAPTSTMPAYPSTSTPVGAPYYPGTGQPSMAAPLPGGQTPADRAPTLAPTEQPGSRGTQPVPEIRNRPVIPTKPNAEAPAAGETPKNTAPVASPPVKPVPDPEAGERKQIPAAPSLFDPRDKTASRAVRPGWDVAPIVWPEKAAAADTRPVTLSLPAIVPPEPKRLDTEGWKAVQP